MTNTEAYHGTELITTVKYFLIQAPGAFKCITPRANVIKLFLFVIYKFLNKAIVFVPGNPFQPNLMLTV
jgi:hypothetical protein